MQVRFRKAVAYRRTVCRLADLTPGSRRVAGLITGLRTTQGRRGRMAIATLDDRSARIEVVVYAETLPAVAEVLAKGRIVVAEGFAASTISTAATGSRPSA